MSTFKLSTLVEVQSRFGRSVNLERDFYADVPLDGYVFTNTTATSLRRLSRAINDMNSERAWTLTGAYGSGKSTFGLFAAKLFSLDSHESAQAKSILKLNAPDLSRELFGTRSATPKFFPILVSGAREPLGIAILRGIKIAVINQFGDSGTSYVSRIEEMTRSDKVTGKAIVELLLDIVASLEALSNQNLGLLLIIDELGKLLEFAAIHPDKDKGDLFILQELAEATKKSKTPFFLMTILHQAFERYAERLGRGDREEWAKIQGRFEDLPFQEPNEQVLYILQGALVQKRESSGYYLLSQAGQELGKLAVDLGICGFSDRSEAVELLTDCLPLHPTAAIAIGSLFRRHGQNERSLFAFLTSNEPFGLPEFTENTFWSKESTRLVTLDHVYDYFVSSMGSALYGGPDGRKWAEIDTAIRNNPNATNLEIRLLKVIGLLNLLGDSGKLKSSRDILRFALMGVGVDNHDVDLAMSHLKSRSAITERRFNDTFVIWEGSDVDLDECFRAAESQIDASTPLAVSLTKYFKPRPIVAKKHSYRTGTLRYFETAYVDPSDLNALQVDASRHSDGRIIFVLVSSLDEYRDLLSRFQDQSIKSDQATVIALPRNLEELRDSVFRTVCWRWVGSNTPELESDRVARVELAARLASAEQRVLDLLQDWHTSNTGEGCTWFWMGEQREFQTPRAMQEFLSQVFDTVYSNTPIILNELINRNTLSSAASAARRALFEAMSLKASTKQLDIDGFPPQLSMYYSLLDETSIHRNEAGRYGFFPPLEGADRGIRAVWAEIEKFLDSTARDPRSLSDLFAQLQKPPFGLKSGFLPILVSAVLLHFESEVAVYERGNFLPKLTLPIFERICRAPEVFTVQLCRIAGLRTQVLDKIGNVLLPDLIAGKKVDVLTIVRPLARFAQDLEEFTQNTTRLSEDALRIRRALFSAREPDKLLFKALPEACGLAEFDSKSTATVTNVEEFAARLHRGLGELKRAYQELLNELESMLQTAFSLASESGRLELTHRARSVSEFVASSRLRSLIIRITDEDLDRQHWIESIAALLAGKPPLVWRDEDITHFEIGLAELSRSFTNLELVTFERRRQDPDKDKGMDFVRLSLTEFAKGEHERVLSIYPHDAEKMDAAEVLILKAFDDSGINGNVNVRLATLARLSLKLINTDSTA